METPSHKFCRKCGQTKPAEAFGPAKHGRDKLQCWCQACRCKLTVAKQRKVAAAKAEAKYLFHGGDGMKRCAYCKEVKPFSQYKDDAKFYGGVKSFCIKCGLAKRKQKYANTRERSKAATKKWRIENRLKRNASELLKIQSNPEYKVFIACRKRISGIMKKQGERSKTSMLLGCSKKFLRSYLESQFKEGMTWDNYGRSGWHIDHIYPCSAFDLTDPEQIRQCFHYSNLQPLWENENCSKNDSLQPNQPKPLSLSYE
jgi:hypothetical protein